MEASAVGSVFGHRVLNGICLTAHREPCRTALIDGERISSYRELWTDITDRAAHFRLHGVTPGSRTVVVARSDREVLVSVLASWLNRCSATILSHRLTIDELRRVLRLVGPELLFADRIRNYNALRDSESWPVLCSGWKCAVEPVRHPGSYSSVIGDEQLILLTSGTTGDPKGVVIGGRSRMRWVEAIIAEYALRPADVFLPTVPVVHSSGFTFALAHLAVGAALVLQSERDGPSLRAAVEKHRVTRALVVPTTLARLLEAAGGEEIGMSLEDVISMGAPMDLDLKRRFLAQNRTRLIEYYGCTEHPNITLLRGEEQLAKGESVGKAFPGVSIRVVNETGDVCDSTQVGRVQVSGPFLMEGYLVGPDKLVAPERGWFTTGDLGWLDRDGYLHLVGRHDDVIVTGGINVQPAEVERYIMSHPDVADVAVVGMPDPRWGERVLAAVSLKPGAKTGPDDIATFCGRGLASYKCPAKIVIVAAVPRSPTGKLLRSQVKAQLAQGLAAGG